jgi:hypothetical protein
MCNWIVNQPAQLFTSGRGRRIIGATLTLLEQDEHDLKWLGHADGRYVSDASKTYPRTGMAEPFGMEFFLRVVFQ